MNDSEEILLSDIVNEEVTASREQMYLSLQNSIRNHQKRRFAMRSGVLGIAGLSISAFIFWTVELRPDARMPDSLANIDTRFSSSFSTISSDARVQYVDPEVLIIPLSTRIAVTSVVNDNQLLEIFSNEAYAVVEDENDQIEAFYLLASVSPSPQSSIR
jgi:hypothetical protein